LLRLGERRRLKCRDVAGEHERRGHSHPRERRAAPSFAASPSVHGMGSLSHFHAEQNHERR
jgi:hypothetical protein